MEADEGVALIYIRGHNDLPFFWHPRHIWAITSADHSAREYRQGRKMMEKKYHGEEVSWRRDLILIPYQLF